MNRRYHNTARRGNQTSSHEGSGQVCLDTAEARRRRGTAEGCGIQGTPRFRGLPRVRGVHTSFTHYPHDPFWDLLATARQLPALDGCAWDRAQTIDSLLPHLIEETWEVFEAARTRRRKRLQEELGDVLYTVLFLALIAERQGRFRLADVLRGTRAKMLRRHPHVFGTKQAGTAREAYQHWQRRKRLEGRNRASSPSRRLREQLLASWDRLLTRERVKRKANA